MILVHFINNLKFEIMIKGMKKARATKDWKTSVISIVAFLLIGLNLIWPDLFDTETQASILDSLQTILTGAATLIVTLIGIFNAEDV